MEADSTADMQFVRRTPGRFSVEDGSAGTEKRERLTASPRRLAPRDPGIPAPCLAAARAAGQNFHVFLEDGLRGAGTLSPEPADIKS
jgi:hypothetical protein